jgi:hypothetical protein
VEDVAVMSRSHMMRHTKAWLVDQCFQRQLPWDGTKEELAGRWAGWWVGWGHLVVLSVVVGRWVGWVGGWLGEWAAWECLVALLLAW